jgi:5-methylcytosine-specific restriction enzyme A
VKRTGLQRTTGLRATPKPRKRQRDTGPDEDTRELVRRRANYGCERCGLARGKQIHHRDPRGAGGSSRPEVNHASNLVLLCADCHLHVESKRLEAVGEGFLIPDGLHPLNVPVRLFYGLHKLTDDGGTIPLPEPSPAGSAVWTSDDPCDCAEEGDQ